MPKEQFMRHHYGPNGYVKPAEGDFMTSEEVTKELEGLKEAQREARAFETKMRAKIRIALFTGEISFDTSVDAAEFWFAYMKLMVPGLEEQCQKNGQEYAANVFKHQFANAAKA